MTRRRILTINPNSSATVGKGRLASGYDADFTLVDMGAKGTIEHSRIVSPCGWTPFAEKKITVCPMTTVVRAHTVMSDDEVQSAPIGCLARFAP
jgi:dihydroorotase